MKKLFIQLLLLFTTSALFAQNDVTVNVAVHPPYSPYLSTYVDQPNKILLTLINTSGGDRDIKLWVKISGDNGVSVTTAANFNPAQPIHLDGTGIGSIKNIDFSTDETRDYFDANHVDLVGITKSQLIQNQALPEGNYTICVRALDFRAPYPPVSADGCTTFPIFYIDPPTPIQPTCGTSVPVTTPQFVLFSWTPPATAQGLINYEFTLKEVPNNLNPYDVIKMNIYPVLFNTTQVSNNTLVYSTAFPQLEEGKKYVWQVRATGDGVQFKNNGYSDACTFIWGSENTAVLTATYTNTNLLNTPLKLKTPENGATVDAVISENTSLYPNHYLFEWYAPAVMNKDTPLMAYHLRIAHVLDGQTPAQALATDSQVVVKTIEGNPTYNYNALSDFSPNQTYAWEVKGISNVDGGDKVYYSQQWTFKVKKNYGKYTVNGKIDYCYDLPSHSTWNNSSGSMMQNPANIDLGTTPKACLPYKNSIVGFYKAILVKEGNNTVVAMDGTDFISQQNKVSPGKSTYFQDAGELVGIAFTDENGHFTFKTDEVLGKVFDTTANGKTYNYYKALKVTLGPYGATYLQNPDEYVILDGGSSAEKTFHARVKSFKLKVKFKELPKKNYYNKTEPVEELPKNITIYVLRENRYPAMSTPHNEGMSNDANNEQLNICLWGGYFCQNYDVVSKKKTTTGTTITFDDLILNDPNNTKDKFYLYATMESKNEPVMLPQEYRSTDGASNTCNLTFNDLTFQASSDYEKVYNHGCLTKSVTIVPKMLVSSALSGRLVSHWNRPIEANGTPNDKPDQPLANTKVKLMAYMVKQNGNGVEEVIQGVTPQLFDVATTDANGNFKFDVNIWSDSSNKSTVLGDFPFFGQTATRVLRVVVDNPYYYSPDNSFVIDGGYEYQVGTLPCYVRETIIGGTIREDGAPYTPIANQRVYLCRWDGDYDDLAPKDEGQKSTVTVPTIKDKDGYEYRVIAEATTKSNGTFNFNRLAGSGYESKTGHKEWRYYVHVQPDELSTNNYITEYPDECHFAYQGAFNDLTTFNSEQPPVTNSIGTTIYAKALLPTIRGVLHPKSNMGYTTLEGANVYLLQYTDADVAWPNTVLTSIMNTQTNGNYSDACALLGLEYFQSAYHYHVYSMQKTGADGKFQFDNIALKQWLGTSPYHYTIWVEKYGFLTEVVKVNGGNPLLKGQQFPLFIDLRLPLDVEATVEQTDHSFGVPSKIIVGNSYSWKQTHQGACKNTFDGLACEETATLQCPVGNVWIYVYPENQDAFMPDSFYVQIHSDTKKLPVFRVRPRKHYFDFIVTNKNTGTVVPKIGVKLLGANVNNFEGILSSQVVQEPAQPEIKTNFFTMCSFSSNATDFAFNVYGEDDDGIQYVPKYVSVHSDPQFYTGTFLDVNAQLERGATFSGYVRNGIVGVAGAKVYVDAAFTGGVPIETITDGSGKYTLKGIPMKNNVVIHATKQNFIGDKITISYNFGAGIFVLSPFSYTYTKDFALKSCPLDIATILGFKVEATDMLQVMGSGNIKLSGRFVDLPVNEVLSGKSNSVLDFTNIELKAGTTNGASGKPLAVPVSLPIHANNFFMPAKAYSMLDATIMGPSWSGIEVDERTTVASGGEGKGGQNGFTQPIISTFGVIKGSLIISSNSYAQGIKFKSPYFTARPKNASDVVFDVFNSYGTKPSSTGAGFTVEELNGTNLRYTLFSRYPDAEAFKATSTLTSGDILTLDTRLHTKLNNVVPEDDSLEVGKAVFSPKSSPAVLTGAQGKMLSIKLGNWSVTSNDWYVSPNAGLVMKTGTLNTAVSVPFKDMSLTYTDLMYGEFEFNNMTLGGIVPLTIEPDATRTFGFDKGVMGGSWTFIVLPNQNSSYCSSFGNLPGMSGNNQFYIKSIRSFSKTDQTKVELKSDMQPIGIYNVSKFSPGSMDVGSDNIAMIGGIDFGIPAITYNPNMKLMWKKTANGTVLQLPEAPSFTMKTKGIFFEHKNTNAYTFSDNLFSIRGTLGDEKNSPNQYAFNVELTKTPNSITLKTFDNNNKFPYNTLGNRGLEHVTGTMSVGNGDWNHFAFSGDMFGMEGGIKESQKKVYMTIKGDIVADPNNAVGVTGVESPLGTMSFVYDFQQQALVGSSHIGSDIGDEHASIDVELMLASDKYYVAGSGEITFPPDFWVKKASSAFFAGKVNSFPDKVSTMFSNFTYDHSKPAFLNGAYTGIAGAFGVKMPIPKVPQFKLSFKPFASCGIEHEICINAITGLNFSGTPTLNLDAMAAAHLHVYAGASVVVGCIHMEATGDALIGIHGQFSKDGASLGGTAILKLTGSGEIGGGLCDSDCDGIFCETYCKGVQFTGEIHGNYSTTSGLDLGSDGVSCGGTSCP